MLTTKPMTPAEKAAITRDWDYRMAALAERRQHQRRAIDHAYEVDLDSLKREMHRKLRGSS